MNQLFRISCKSIRSSYLQQLFILMILSAAKLMIFLRDNRILLRKMVYAVWRAGLVGALQAPLPADAKRQRQCCARGVGLYQQANSAFRLDECLRIRHDYGIDLLVRHRRLIPAGMEAAGIDFPGTSSGRTTPTVIPTGKATSTS